MKSTADVINARNAGASPEDIANQLLSQNAEILDVARTLAARRVVPSFQAGLALTISACFADIPECDPEHRNGLLLNFAKAIAQKIARNIPIKDLAHAFCLSEHGPHLPSHIFAAAMTSPEGGRCSIEGMTRTLCSSNGLNIPAHTVARILRNTLRVSYRRITTQLQNTDIGNLTPSEVACALADPNGLSMPPGEVANALVRSHVTFPETARALRDAYSLSPENIAKILYTDVELRDCDSEDMIPSMIAHALYSPRGLGLDAERVIEILDSADGLFLPPEEVIRATVGINLEPARIPLAAGQVHPQGYSLG